jgi:MoaA/NifB/PqqE/SkfB family radical SAM enzyme
MANVLLTTRCNLRCPYCFAQEKLSEGQRLSMALSDAEKVMDFLQRSNHPLFRVMGGEPTLHPDFPRILEMALRKGMRVDVLSNATWPESYNELFRRISPRRVVFLLNIDLPERYAPNIWQRIEQNLAAISDRGSITLSFNIFEKQPRYEYIFELTKKYGIDKIRMSFSLPVVGANNACLKLEDYKDLAPFVVGFARRAEEEGVQVKMDNAVPLCMFTHEQAGELLLKGVIDLERNMRCSPVIDIGPDLRVWCCFCLSKMWNRHLDEFENLDQVRAHFQRALSVYQDRLYPLEACTDCRYRDRWHCQGGCLTHTVMKYGELVAEIEPAQQPGDGWKPGTALALSPDVLVRRFDMPEESYAVTNRVTGMELEVDASFAPLLGCLDGHHSPGEIIDRYLGNSSQPAPSLNSLHAMTKAALRQGANELLHNMLQQELIVERVA